MEMQQLKELSLASLAEIDGKRLSIAFEQALTRVIADCDDRPGEKKPRTIMLKVEVVPVLDGNICDNAKVQATIHDDVPKRKSKIFDMSLRKRAGKAKLLFRPDSLDEVDQQTMDFGNG